MFTLFFRRNGVGGPGGIVYNSAVLLGPEGLLGVYRKTHLLTERFDRCGGGRRRELELRCIGYPIGKIGMVVCCDEISPSCARNGSDGGGDYRSSLCVDEDF